jgi:hypothetical protein
MLILKLTSNRIFHKGIPSCRKRITVPKYEKSNLTRLGRNSRLTSQFLGLAFSSSLPRRVDYLKIVWNR